MYKKAFALLELIIVLILLFIITFIVVTSFKIKDTKKEIITIENIKSKLLEKYDFNQRLQLLCLEENLKCYIKKDGKVQTDTIDNLFLNHITVYTYEEEPKEITYKNVELNDFVNQSVMFKLNINNDKKSNEFILKIDENTFYVFNAIYSKAKRYNSLGQIKEEFIKRQNKVKNAF